MDKAIWKQVMATSLLFGKAVVVAAKSTINKVQSLENRVYKYLRGLGGYVTIAAPRGEIGASRMESRIMETMLMYARDTITGNFEEVKKYMIHDIQTGKGEWVRTVNDYRMRLDISCEDLRPIDRNT